MKWSDTTRRCGNKAVQLRQFMNALRQVMGKDELYPTGGQRTIDRFYVAPLYNTDGRKALRRNTV